ncbi:alpha/beta fold hydrolase [Paenibacillus chitinolyticus]|uniref:alpha/beta fold hydrolase n=1 Tax=Paenibacillus chitinolyticus TaxID=79263 RepID=UPI0038699576
MHRHVEDGVTVHYNEYPPEEGNGQTLVFLHGLGLDRTIWNGLLPYFAGHYRIVLYDLPGHGLNTELQENSLDWDFVTADLRRVMKALEITSAHLVGHGIGASAAVQFCRSYPECVDRLVLISLPVKIPADLIRRKIAERKRLIKEGVDGLAAELAAFKTSLPVHTSAFQVVRDAYRRMNPDVYVGFMELFTEGDGWKELKFIARHTLVLAGEYDPIYVTAASLAVGVLPSASFLIVPGAANMPFVEQPGTTALWIERFLHRKDSRPLADEPLVRELRDTLQLFLDEGEKQAALAQVLKIDLLGSFRVFLNGREMVDGWNRRYAKSLLVYMIFHPTATREELCDALFPQISGKAALRNLKVYLNHFKNMLQSFEGGSSIVSVDREYVRLLCLLRCDLLDFLKELEEIRTIDENRRYEPAGRLLARLPDPLLPGLYDEWFVEKKNWMEMEVADLASWMAEKEELRGSRQRAEAYRQMAARFLFDREPEYREGAAANGRRGKTAEERRRKNG